MLDQLLLQYQFIKKLLVFLGFFVGPLGKAVGWRPMSIAGGIISGIGFGTSALAPNIYVLYLTCGVLTGYIYIFSSSQISSV